ncbi:MAG: hypothetical protein JWP89_2804 [Schlesneria sp.]|nr:hypothetical protein [Schlesneria sp.]
MADSARNISVMAIIPRNWRLLTVAGVATVGLACGIGTPALAELWKQSRSESKTLPTESGFSASIRKLKADSRRAAEQGDQAKAIQLAERAAKISEAAAQVVGPTGECSPEETARFLAETRARRGSVNGIAAQTATRPPVRPSLPTAQQPPAAVPRVVATPKAVAAPQVAKAQTAPPVKPSLPRTPSTAVVQQPRKTPIVAVAKATPSDSRSRSAGMSFAAKEPTTSQDVAVGDPVQQRPQAARQVAQAKSSEFADDLLVQSRLEAADGNIDRALRLADQAVAAASHASLFGGANPGNAGEAVRWREHLLARKQVDGVAVATSKSIVAPATKAPTAAIQVAAVKVDWQADSAAPVTRLSTTSADWTASLPPAPSPQVRRDHEPVQFRRSTITRQGEWVDASSAEAMDSNRSRAANDVAPMEESLEQAPIIETVSSTEAIESLPEFVINHFSAQPLPEEASADQAASAVPVVMVDEQVAPIPTEALPEASPLERPPLKLRGTIQQVAAEFPAESSPTKQPNPVTAVRADRVVAAPPAKKKIEPKPYVVRRVPAVQVDAAAIEDDGASENPVQRFPVQRVLQLRQRIESATALDPGASNQPVPKTPAATTPAKSEQQPSAWNSADWEGNIIDRPEPVQKASAEDPPAKRPALKIRERLPVVTDSSFESVANSSNVAGKTLPSVRQKVVGHSSMTPWVSAGQTATGKAESSKTSKSDFQSATGDQPRMTVPGARQPVLEMPVSQVGYEPSAATSGINVASIGDKAESKRGAAEQMDIAPPPPVVEEKDTWFEDSLVRKRAVSSATVRSSSFGLIDRLVYGLNLPASTVVSLIGGGGLLLIGIGLVAVRAALRKRHSA